MADGETGEVADARETLALVYGFALKVAQRAIDHVEKHDVLQVGMDDRIDGAGYSWHVVAAYGRGHKFVDVQATPEHRALEGRMVSIEAFVQVQMNGQAGFHCNVPREWIELASRAAAVLPGGE